MTVISGSLASVCRSRGERRGGGGGEKEKLRVRETQERRGGKPHLCQACFGMDVETGGQSFKFCCAVTSQHSSPFLSCYHNDAELC